MKKVKIYTLNYCPYCKRAKAILQDFGVKFEEIDVTDFSEDKIGEIARELGISDITFPQIIVGETNIGGCDDLEKIVAEQGLTRLLED